MEKYLWEHIELSLLESLPLYGCEYVWKLTTETYEPVINDMVSKTFSHSPPLTCTYSWLHLFRFSIIGGWIMCQTADQFV